MWNLIFWELLSETKISFTRYIVDHHGRFGCQLQIVTQDADTIRKTTF